MLLYLFTALLCLFSIFAGFYSFKKMRGKRRKKFLGFYALLLICSASYLLSGGGTPLFREQLSSQGKSLLSEYFPEALPAVEEALGGLERGRSDSGSLPGGSPHTGRASGNSNESQKAGDLQVDFLDVGQGLSVLVRSGGQTLLYDGGGRKSSSFLVAYLKEQGIQKIDYMAASHYDSDHISGLNGVLNVFEVGRVLGPGYEGDTKLYHSFLEYMDEKQLALEYPAPGDEFTLGSAVITVLAPQNPDPDDDNNSSLVLKIQNGQNSFLLMGDMEAKGEEALLQAGFSLNADVLCVGHHGSSSSTTKAFLTAAAPEYAVISCGLDNSYGHPHKETLKRLEQSGVSLFRTDLQSTVTAFCDGSAIRWSTEPWEEN